MDALDLSDVPPLHEPVLVLALEGWIDAGAATAGAVAALDEAVGATTCGSYDIDRFIDFRARRPVLSLRNGVMTDLVWPRLELKVGRAADGSHVVVVQGAEPDMAWGEFVALTAGFAVSQGVRLVVALGAYPAAVPHTRPARVVATSPDEALALTVGVNRADLDIPAGATAVLQMRCHQLGIPTIGLWAQVPHYAAGSRYPAAAAALLDAFAQVSGIELDTQVLAAAGRTHAAQLDALVAGNTEHVTMIRQLESAYETDVPEVVRPQTPLPSGDELAAELERFLRSQDDEPDPG